MLSVPLPTAAQKKVRELPFSAMELEGTSVIIGGSPVIIKMSLRCYFSKIVVLM